MNSKKLFRVLGLTVRNAWTISGANGYLWTRAPRQKSAPNFRPMATDVYCRGMMDSSETTDHKEHTEDEQKEARFRERGRRKRIMIGCDDVLIRIRGHIFKFAIRSSPALALTI